MPSKCLHLSFLIQPPHLLFLSIPPPGFHCLCNSPYHFYTSIFSHLFLASSFSHLTSSCCMPLHISPLGAPGAKKKKKIQPTVTGDSRKELLAQHFSTRVCLNQRPARQSGAFTHVHVHSHTHTQGVQVQPLNYTITQSSNCPQQELFICLYHRIILPFVL